jgi:hypothetical protein
MEEEQKEEQDREVRGERERRSSESGEKALYLGDCNPWWRRH